MDWDSPTTKKHVAEAKAQGCELLGPGKDARYRAYRLPCGHEKDVQMGDMRRGSFRCQICLDNNLAQEAQTQGCVLLGPGNNCNYRTYRLPCGHEQIVQVKQMRAGGFRCRTCIDNQYTDEAKAQGCELLGPGRTNIYRTYRFPCGHVQESQASLIRKGEFQCQTCLNEKLKAEAEAQGCELLTEQRQRRTGIKNAPWRSYRLPCGHEQRIQATNMRIGRFRCQTCQESKIQDEAEAQGCVLLGPGRTARHRLYRLECGHEQDIETGNMRDGEFACQTCLINKHIAEAEARGCELLGKGSSFNYRTYRLPCGHEQEITLQNMRLGNFRCHSCEEYFYTLPSQAYLLHIKVGADQWLKLGYAKDIDFRTTQYGLPSEAEVSLVATKPFDTGKEAREFEGSLHRKHRRKRLRAKDMAEFHTSGGTECYPVTMVETLLAEFHDPK
jgi:hypothetical protein